MNSRILAKAVYVIFGVGFIVVGAIVLLYRTDLLSDNVRAFILDLADGNLNTLHAEQEFACLLVFAGLITLWFVRHYDVSLFFHWAMTLFWALIVLIHWFHVSGANDFDIGVLINAIPFFIFLAVGMVTLNRKLIRA